MSVNLIKLQSRNHLLKVLAGVIVRRHEPFKLFLILLRENLFKWSRFFLVIQILFRIRWLILNLIRGLLVLVFLLMKNIGYFAKIIAIVVKKPRNYLILFKARLDYVITLCPFVCLLPVLPLIIIGLSSRWEKCFETSLKHLLWFELLLLFIIILELILWRTLMH